MKQVYISQPMNGKTKKEIKDEREKAIEELCKQQHIPRKEIVVIDNLIRNTSPKEAHKSLWYLGASLVLMSQADIVYFAEGWEYARGCIIEHRCVDLYGLDYLECGKTKGIV